MYLLVNDTYFKFSNLNYVNDNKIYEIFVGTYFYYSRVKM